MYASERQVQRVSFVQAKTRLCLGCALLVQRSKGKFIKKAQLMFIISSLGDLSQCFCTAPELNFTFHFESILDTSGKNYARPNKNCNLTSCIDGCDLTGGAPRINHGGAIVGISYETGTCPQSGEGSNNFVVGGSTPAQASPVTRTAAQDASTSTPQ